MGHKYTYRCPSCGYSVLTSAGHDFGMKADVDTYICKACEEIVDVIVGQNGVTFQRGTPIAKELLLFDADDLYTCPICSSPDNLVKWSRKRRPCPRCSGKMEIDNSGAMCLWD